MFLEYIHATEETQALKSLIKKSSLISVETYCKEQFNHSTAITSAIFDNWN